LIKAELVREMSVRTRMSQRACNKAIVAAFAIIKEVGHLEYRGFGVFRTKMTPLRAWQTPWNGDANVSLGKSKLTFQESKPNRRRK